MKPPARFLSREKLQSLLDTISAQGYECIGPQLRDGAIVYDKLQGVAQLPKGIEAAQAPGSYRIEQGGHERCFAWANGPQALKPLVFSPHETLWQAVHSTNGKLEFKAVISPVQRRAVLGVRACDLAALKLQDQHFLEGSYPDPYYAARREGLLLIAVNCSHPAATCFCHSTGDGPEARVGYDLVMTELESGYLIDAGSVAGEAILAELETEDSSPEQSVEAESALEAAARQQRKLPSQNLRNTLFTRLNHPRWDDVAERCLSCGNCTSVCPTCFCHSEHDDARLDGGESSHIRQWDSCFTEGHSYIHGVTIRQETRLRYRQWLTHKLAGWHDQYGRSGCVGCGRCISWCPVGIDLTVEVEAICEGECDG
jgi:sulfhydrogenase subunit beta (sulfur reductase)